MKPIIFSLFPPSKLFTKVAETNSALEIGDALLEEFPDKETYLKINSNVKDRTVIVMTSFNNVNNKILPLLFFSRTAKELGAKEVGLVAPYLAYMRQDKRFSEGECVSSRCFSALLSQYFDWLVTIDPHLHRYKNLAEIYTIPTVTLHAEDKINEWIVNNLKNPIIIGPDIESKQWAESIARKSNIPYVILEKTRHGGTEVEVSIPTLHKLKFDTVVLIDDIISTGNTMIETIKHLKKLKIKSIVCIGIHALFTKDAYETLKRNDVSVITCNTIDHETNAIDVSSLIVPTLHLIK